MNNNNNNNKLGNIQTSNSPIFPIQNINIIESKENQQNGKKVRKFLLDDFVILKTLGKG